MNWNNDHIQLKPIRNGTNIKKKYYTDQEKYKKLVTDFPLLARLKDVLDLELDF